LVLLPMLALLFTLVISVASFALVLFSQHVVALPHNIPHIGVVSLCVITLPCIVLKSLSITLCWCSSLVLLLLFAH
jgi:hypothetical protein